MRITIIALGSRGDVQPFIALARGMIERGHMPRIVAADDYGDLVRSYGVPFHSVGGSINKLMDREVVYQAQDGATNPLHLARRFLREVNPLVQRIMQASHEASKDTDLILASTLGVFVARHIAEALQVPLVPCHFHPYAATRAYPSVFFPSPPRWFPFRGNYNRVSQWLTDQGYWHLLRRSLNLGRHTILGLRPWSLRDTLVASAHTHTRVLYGYSTHVAPRPSDWDTTQHVTGYWMLDAPPQWTPAPELVRFLSTGEPPVYISSGSMLVGRDPQTFTAMIVRAVERGGRRAIIHAGWDDWGHAALPASILKVHAVPHAWLFDHVAAVVTHGGAGTTAAALRAGTGLVVVPFLGDQRFWGERIHALGLAPRPLPRRQLSSEVLAVRIDDALHASRASARATIAKHLRAEDGITAALQVLQLC